MPTKYQAGSWTLEYSREQSTLQVKVSDRIERILQWNSQKIHIKHQL